MTNAMKAKHNQWVNILGSVFKVLAEIFSRLKLPEAEGKIKKEKAEHPLVPKPAENKYL